MILGLAGGIANGTYAFLLANLFPTAVRFGGVTLALNLATALFTGLTPLLTTQLLRLNGSRAAPGLYLAGTAAISLWAGLGLKRYGGQVAAHAARPTPTQ